MSGPATAVGAAVFAIAWLIGAVMLLALLGLSNTPDRIGAKTFLRMASYVSVICMGVGLVTAFVDAVDADDYSKATAVAAGVASVALLFLMLISLCLSGSLQQQQWICVKPMLVVFVFLLGTTVMGIAAVVCYQVEWDVTEHTAMKVGACVTGASGFSVLVLTATFVMLMNRAAESEEECSTRTYSMFAVAGLCLLSLLVLAGSCLVWLTDAVSGESNVRKATALASAVLGVSALIATVALLAFLSSWTKPKVDRAANKAHEIRYLVIAGICFGVICVCALLMVSWELDWPGGQGPAVLGGFLGVCGLFSLVVMLYICASLPKWTTHRIETTEVMKPEAKPAPVPLMVPEAHTNSEETMPDNVDLPTRRSWALDEGPDEQNTT
mmetsp:Transcript_3931/g.10915  ORF Transcript_3931/g.10915 Transcript_3931/m.10915 type:complete len:383 (-) Transcript_3931:219-1367(-)